MSLLASVRSRSSMYSTATAVLLLAYCLILLFDLVSAGEAPLGFTISLSLAILAALAAGICLVMGDSLGPWPALLFAAAQVITIILFITVLRMPISTLSLTVQLPVLALYFGAFQKPYLARLALAGLLLAVFVVVRWDPADQLVQYGGGRNAVSVLVFTWLCLEAGLYVQRRFRQETGIDALTGVLNRRGFVDRSVIERARSQRSGRPICVAMADLDDFKLINDELGHDAGDRVLKDLVSQWKSRMRETDVITRIGGDEFIFILPDAGLDDAKQLLERLRIAAVHPWSYGVAQWNPIEMISAAIAEADAEMYRDKLARKGAGGHGSVEPPAPPQSAHPESVQSESGQSDSA